MSQPYMWGETTGGPSSARSLSSEGAARRLSRADNVLFILGSDLDEYPVDTLKEIIKRVDGTVGMTGPSKGKSKEIEPDFRLGIVEIVDLLCSENGWKGDYDCIVFAGLPYHIESRMLSGLNLGGVKNVITLNRRHQQFADYSFPNILNPEKWEQSLNEILGEL